MFRAEVEQLEDRLIVRLSEGASQALPSRGQVAVTGTVDGQEIATVIEPDGRRGHWIAVDRLGLDLAAGVWVTLELTPTRQWPEPEVPVDLSTALAEASDVAQTWSDITPMARWEWVRWISATKNEQTRERRIEVGLSKLRSGKRRPCCFDLASCTDPELSRNGKLLGLS